ncbi:MAG: sigma factor-like helix-turn-helix DNA-binding protein [Faecousia sp.]
MGFNYASEKRKFEKEWAKLRQEYKAAGMSDAAIQEMHDFDWNVFKQERNHQLHTQEMSVGTFDEPSTDQEDKSALMKKFLEAVSCWDNYTGSSRYGWVEEIEDPILYKKVRLLSPDELELLTLVVVDDFSQSEVAAIYGCTQQNIAKKLRRIKKYFQKRL